MRADFIGMERSAREPEPAAFRLPSFVAVGLTIAGALAAILLLMYLLPAP